MRVLRSVRQGPVTGVDFSAGMLVQPVTSSWYWALLGFDLAMPVRNAVWRPPFVMYYRAAGTP